MIPRFILFAGFLLLLFLKGNGQNTQKISASNPNILYTGRIDYSNPDQVRFSHPGVSAKIKFEGTIFNILLNNYCNKKFDTLGNCYYVIVDRQPPVKICMTPYDHIYRVKNLQQGIHTVEIIKLTESMVGEGVIRGFEIEKGKKTFPVSRPVRKIEFIGNSITCGYGNEGDSVSCPFSPLTENNYLAYGAITARNVNADYMAVAYSGKGVIRNYDLTGETLPQVYDDIIPEQKQVEWDFSKWIPDVVVINLGTNDFAHSKPDSAEFVSTYLSFLLRIRKNYPKAFICCIQGSMIRDGWPVGILSLSIIKKYQEAAVTAFRKEKDPKIDTFYLTTAGEGDLGCDYHPNLRMHRKMAEELTQFLRRKMNW